MEISREDSKWLLAIYNPVRQLGRVDKYIDQHCQALSIFRGTPVGRPECTCQYGATARIASSMYEQYESLIIETAKEPVINEPTTDTTAKRRGRKRSETNTKE